MRLYLINPSNPLVSILHVKESRWNRYRVWKPLSLMTIAGLTPQEWDVTIVDENLGIPDYSSMPMPDLVGVTAFTSQANRAYEIAAWFRERGVPVVMGGIHATMRIEEAREQVDSVVTGEAEEVWGQVLDDVRKGELKPLYDGGLADVAAIPDARHDLLNGRYALGAIQTTRGCPLNCNFCSVSAFNGTHYRQRPIDDVVRELRNMPEKRVLVVDDNLIGTSRKHIARAKDLFRAMIKAGLDKQWIAQATVNFADDEELLTLAAKAGCRGVFIGFETLSPEGIKEIGKKFNLLRGRDFRESVRKIQRHKIQVVGSFIIGLDVDEAGIGKRIADVADKYGIDNLNVLFLTPLPGTKLWETMNAQERVTLDNFPVDWRYYTLTYPVAKYAHLSLDDAIDEMMRCNRQFYSVPNILKRISRNLLRWRRPLITILANFSYRGNLQRDRDSYVAFRNAYGDRFEKDKTESAD